MDEIAVSLRFALAVVFVLAGSAKLIRVTAFEQAVRGYGLLPVRLVRPFALAVPTIEVLLGVLFALGLGLRPMALVAAALLALFAAAVASALVRHRDITCGCFGSSGSERVSWRIVARNGALVVAALLLALQAPTGLALDSLLGDSRPSPSSGDAMAAAVLAVTALAVLALARASAAIRRAEVAWRATGAQP